MVGCRDGVIDLEEAIWRLEAAEIPIVQGDESNREDMIKDLIIFSDHLPVKAQ